MYIGKKGAMTVADRHACECAMDLIKFTINSSVSTVRNIELLQSISLPMNSLNIDQKTIGDADIGNTIDSTIDNQHISLKLDFSKNSHFPIVAFLSKS
jgi:hypothetical protein